MATKKKELSARSKIAIFLMFLGADLSRDVVKNVDRGGDGGYRR